ncbi:MAG: hypothetical protein KBT27_06540 [Prevotellaceae bacterium]|nr:hypothetical protein [Candidatus Faecinaster equi]
MFADKVKFKDFFGVEKEVTCYFNYDEHEVLKMEAGQTESVTEKLKRIMGSKNKEEIMAAFSEFILGAYGELADDNNTLLKTPEIRRKFECSKAYNAVFMKFMTESDTYPLKFIQATMPDMKQLGEQLENAQKKLPQDAMTQLGV